MDTTHSDNHAGSGGSKDTSAPRANRGFAAMDPGRQRQIASEGGRAAHKRGTAHEFTSQEAREAGRKGGLARAESNSSRAKPQADDGAPEATVSVTSAERFDRPLGGEPGVER